MKRMTVEECYIKYGPPKGILIASKHMTKRKIKKLEEQWHKRSIKQ